MNEYISGCPIGLLCDYFKRNCRVNCSNFIKPIPEPYLFKVPNEIKALGLIVRIPDYYDAIDEFNIDYADECNQLVENTHIELFNNGFWEAVDLPYKPHHQGGLLVTHYLPINDEIAFSAPLSQKITHWEAFAPAVPANKRYCGYSFLAVQEDGFYPDWWLSYSHSCPEDDDEEE